jgi:hypothetical protein
LTIASAFAAILEHCGIGMNGPGLYGGQRVPAANRAQQPRMHSVGQPVKLLITMETEPSRLLSLPSKRAIAEHRNRSQKLFRAETVVSFHPKMAADDATVGRTPSEDAGGLSAQNLGVNSELA